MRGVSTMGGQLSIGMTTQQVMAKANSMGKKLSAENKQIIINFCKTDIDKKISNGNELHMLNTWITNNAGISLDDHGTQKDGVFVPSYNGLRCEDDRYIDNLFYDDVSGVASSRTVIDKKTGAQYVDKNLDGNLKLVKQNKNQAPAKPKKSEPQEGSAGYVFNLMLNNAKSQWNNFTKKLGF